MDPLRDRGRLVIDSLFTIAMVVKYNFCDWMEVVECCELVIPIVLWSCDASWGPFNKNLQHEIRSNFCKSSVGPILLIFFGAIEKDLRNG
jgi:hypothetical protein